MCVLGEPSAGLLEAGSWFSCNKCCDVPCCAVMPHTLHASCIFYALSTPDSHSP